MAHVIFCLLFHAGVLLGCSGSIQDLKTLKASKTNPNGSGAPSSDSNSGPNDSGANSPNPSTPTSPSSGGTGGNSSGGSGGDGSGNDTPTAPQVTILNINSNYLRGGVSQDILFKVVSPVGALSRVEYVVSCVTSTASPEKSVTSGVNPNTASAVTIQENVVSVGAGEDTIVTWNTPTLASVKCVKPDSTLEQAANSFKIRITSIGQNKLSTSVESTSFQIDSDPPVLASSGLSCSLSGCVFGGIAQINFHGITDSVTPVDSICAKLGDASPPAVDDLCWRPISNMGADTNNPYSPQAPGDFTSSNFFGFMPVSGQIFFWAKDGAGNTTVITNNDAGTENKDTILINSNGTGKIANSDATFLSTAKGLFHSASAGDKLTFLNGTLNDQGATKSLKSFYETETGYVNHLGDLNSISMDSNSKIFIKDAAKGLIKINTLILDNGADPAVMPFYNVLIPKTGTLNFGDLSTATLKNPKRHFIDSKGYHWFLDDNKLSYIDFSSANPQLIHVAGGGSDDTSDNFTDPKSLLIHSSDNIDAFGLFVVLPNQWVVFSADDPTLPLNPATGNRFKLRVYKHSEVAANRSISTIYLSGSSSQGATDNLIPFGGLALNYDSVRNNIKNITGRFCQIAPDILGGLDHCSSAKLIQFSISTQTNPIYLGSLSQDSLLNFQYLKDSLYMADLSKGTISIWSASGFNKVLGANSRGSTYCTNLSVSTDCGLRIMDFKPLANGNDQILLLDENYIRILEQGQIFTIFSAGP